jgi:hypothetical protein
MQAEEPSDDFLGLVEAAEDVYGGVTLEQLRHLARSQLEWQHLSRGLARRLRQAVKGELLLCDERLRLTRGGNVAAIRLYRLNRRHPRLEIGLI